jgi:vancomycin resistance protein YoaR
LHGDDPIERVARFTTFFDCCQARVTNIRTIAAAVDGTVVLPGHTFSIDELIGPRTSAKGYVPAPYLQNGEGRCCAVGGGVSQFGTTIHNAVFWGGYQIDRHQPHSGVDFEVSTWYRGDPGLFVDRLSIYQQHAQPGDDQNLEQRDIGDG